MKVKFGNREVTLSPNEAVAGYMDPNWEDGWPLNGKDEPCSTALNPATWTQERLESTKLRRTYDRANGSVNSFDPIALESIAQAVGLNAWGSGKFDKDTVVGLIVTAFNRLKSKGNWGEVVASNLHKYRFDGWEDAYARIAGNAVPVEVEAEVDDEPEPVEYDEPEVVPAIDEQVDEQSEPEQEVRKIRLVFDVTVVSVEEQ